MNSHGFEKYHLKILINQKRLHRQAMRRAEKAFFDIDDKWGDHAEDRWRPLQEHRHDRTEA